MNKKEGKSKKAFSWGKKSKKVEETKEEETDLIAEKKRIEADQIKLNEKIPNNETKDTGASVEETNTGKEKKKKNKQKSKKKSNKDTVEELTALTIEMTDIAKENKMAKRNEDLSRLEGDSEKLAKTKETDERISQLQCVTTELSVIAEDNVGKLGKRGENLSDLETRAAILEAGGQQFEKIHRKRFCTRKKKIVGCVVAVVIAVVIAVTVIIIISVECT